MEHTNTQYYKQQEEITQTIMLYAKPLEKIQKKNLLRV